MSTADFSLLEAAREGNLEVIEAFFKNENASKEFGSIKNEYSLATPLHMAAANDHVQALGYMLQHLSKDLLPEYVNAQNDAGNTPLHWAALTGSMEAAKLLIEAGANASIKNKAGYDPIYQAESADNEGLVEYLLQNVDFNDETISGGQAIPEEAEVETSETVETDDAA